MKIIFLDIDGILSVNYCGRDKYGSLFHQKFENNLKYIIDETNAKIVISSTWRFSGLKVLQQMWKDRNLAGEVVDITPDCAQITDGFMENVERGHEIQQWLSKHQVENYVILDDDQDMLDSQKDHFVLCSGNSDHEDCEDIGYGLTKICANKAIEILNKKL